MIRFQHILQNMYVIFWAEYYRLDLLDCGKFRKTVGQFNVFVRILLECCNRMCKIQEKPRHKSDDIKSTMLW